MQAGLISLRGFEACGSLRNDILRCHTANFRGFRFGAEQSFFHAAHQSLRRSEREPPFSAESSEVHASRQVTPRRHFRKFLQHPTLCSLHLTPFDFPRSKWIPFRLLGHQRS